MTEGEYQAIMDPDPWDFDNEDAIYESSANHPLEDGFWELQGDTPEGAWTTASGDIKISEMTDEHLRNAIAWALRNGYEGSGKLSELQTELEKR